MEREYFKNEIVKNRANVPTNSIRLAFYGRSTRLSRRFHAHLFPRISASADKSNTESLFTRHHYRRDAESLAAATR